MMGDVAQGSYFGFCFAARAESNTGLSARDDIMEDVAGKKVADRLLQKAFAPVDP